MDEHDKITPPDWKEQIEALIQSDGLQNDLCADCLIDATDSNWSVWNHGIFVCIKCAGIHRMIGVDISKVKSTQFDKWKNYELNMVRSKGGNLAVNKMKELRKPKYFINPSQCDGVEDVRKFYIRTKYQHRAFEADNKEDVGCHDMPQRMEIGTFFQESSRKKAYLQLLGRTLYYFKNSADSHDLEHYDVATLRVTISSSDSKYSPFVLLIESAANRAVIHRLRPLEEGQIMMLIEWVHSIRRAAQYFKYLDAHNGANGLHQNGQHIQNGDDQKEQNHDPQNQENGNINRLHLNRRQIQQSHPIAEMTIKDLERGMVLGKASKKGGGVTSWRKRWWVLVDGILYYFKEDFRSNKKAQGIGRPQGAVSLHDSDVVWDVDRRRSGKRNVFMICNPRRTFYIQPENRNKDDFYGAIEEYCESVWDRKPFDFVE